MAKTKGTDCTVTLVTLSYRSSSGTQGPYSALRTESPAPCDVQTKVRPIPSHIYAVTSLSVTFSETKNRKLTQLRLIFFT